MPQIELMQADLPHTLYNRSTDEKKITASDISEAERLTKEAMERKRKAREQRQMEESITIEEIFNTAADNEVATKQE